MLYSEPMNDTLRAFLVKACAPHLRARGPDGLRALRFLQAPSASVPEDPLLLALSQHLSTPIPNPQACPPLQRIVDLPAPQRLIILGDVHGRWDVAQHTLTQHHLLDEHGRWSAPPGTLLVQMGDLLDADLRRVFSPQDDPLANAMLETHRARVTRALQQPHVPSELHQELSPWLAAPPSGADPAPWWNARHDIVTAALVYDTVSAFYALEKQAQDAGGQLLVLTGNHEVDLLAQRHWWYASQKRIFQQLAPPPLITWLATRPVIARVGSCLMMHGGPTRDALERFPAATFPELAQAIEHASAPPFTRPFFTEGLSILSPDRSRDDFIGDPTLLEPWLIASHCNFLVVGHSPFLGFAADDWPDVDRPEVAHKLGRIERLSPLGNVLRVDTNLKRGSRCELLEITAEHLHVLPPEGDHRSLLASDEHIALPRGHHHVLRLRHQILDTVDALRGPALVDLRPVGLNGTELARVLPLVDALVARGESDFRKDYGYLLRAGPEHLDHVHPWLGDALSGGPGLEALHGHRRALADQVAQLARGLHASDDSTLRYYADLRSRTLSGVRYRLTELVLEAAAQLARDEGTPMRPAVAAQLVLIHNRPAVRLSVFQPGASASYDEVVTEIEPDITTWDALEAQARALLASVDLREIAPPAPRAQILSPSPTPNAPAATRPRAGSTPASLPREALERWLHANHSRLLEHAPRPAQGWEARVEMCEGVELSDDLRPGVFEVRGPWPRLRGLLTPSGQLLFADTTFIHPAASFLALDLHKGLLREHPDVLWDMWQPPLRIRLFSALKTAVVARLRAGEAEQLRVSRASGRWSWDAGCFLFTSPNEQATLGFAALNPERFVFDLERATLARWRRRDWAQLNLMLEDAAHPLDESARWGVPFAALEVVALGADGVRALWPCAAPRDA